MSPNKTIYIRQGDEKLWKKAQKLAGDSLSGLIVEAIRRYVEAQELQKDGHEQIIVHHHPDNDGTVVAKGFTGKMLLSDFTPDYSSDPHWENVDAGFSNHNTWHAAVSSKGAFVVWTEDDQGGRENFDIYDSIPAMEDAQQPPPADVITALSAAAGEDYIQELNI